MPSYYGQEHYPYQLYMSGNQPQLGQAQPQAQSQSQSLTQQLLQAQSAQYQQPYGQQYYINQQMQQGQHPLQALQTPQYQQYQQPQQTLQSQVPQQTLQQGEYAAHYPGYGSSASLGVPYQYALYQQNAQPMSSAAAPQALIYVAPGQQAASTQQTPAVATSLAGAVSSQSGAPVASSATTAPLSVPPLPAKASLSSDTLASGGNSSVGQYQPPGIRPRVTTTMWEDEKTLCYQVDANNVSVVRRADNNMINGTKLLNVAQMTRGRRDGILKLEKVRHVVKIGSMHLKGVWIPFERALAMAQRENIVDLLYPLFVRDIKRVIQTGVTPTTQATTTAAAKAPIPAATSYPATSTASTLANPNMSYYLQYPAQYPPATSAAVSEGTPAAPQQQQQQQQQISGQLQLYGYQPAYYNQSYAYNQSSSLGAAASNNYSSNSQGGAPVYSGYPGYQAPLGQGQPQKSYEQSLQPQPIQSHQLPQHDSPGLKKEKEAEKK